MIYILIYNVVDDWINIGAFLSREEAEDHRKALLKNRSSKHDDFAIEEMEIGKLYDYRDFNDRPRCLTEVTQ